MNTLTALPHARLEQALAHKEAELRALLHAVSAPEAATDAGVSDFKDLATVDVQSAIDDVRGLEAARELSQVVAARSRLAAGTYGNCEDCQAAIALERLLALPEAARCTFCQATHEHTSAAS